ncbi:MAG TPA: response regulator [Blastocatellia bacterium]|nr:response regulator [Blastocatellia bacterium]
MLRKKILLVDDAETILMIERMMLNKDYTIVTAKDGQEAVSVAIAERPDLILLDVLMPKMGGFEACKEIRAKPEIGRIPIIMVTTRGDEHSMETGFQNGCNDYVTKPIDGLELISKVRNYLGEPWEDLSQ